MARSVDADSILADLEEAALFIEDQAHASGQLEILARSRRLVRSLRKAARIIRACRGYDTARSSNPGLVRQLHAASLACDSALLEEAALRLRHLDSEVSQSEGQE